MKRLTKSTLGLYLLAIFVAGAAAGVGLGSLSDRRHESPPPPREMAEHIQSELDQKLGLTAAQIAKIRPLVEQSCLELDAIHRDSWYRVNEAMHRLNQRIAEHLTPEQRLKLEQLDIQRREKVRMKCGPHPGEARGRPTAPEP